MSDSENRDVPYYNEEPHKQFLLFGYDDYYPGGGMIDLRGSFDTIAEALAAAAKESWDDFDLYDRIAGKGIDIEKMLLEG